MLDDGEIVECMNICDDPANGFDVSDYELALWCDRAVATWHTHPDGTKLLSVGDHQMFRANHQLIHFIIAPDGLAAYRVQNDIVLNYPVPE